MTYRALPTSISTPDLIDFFQEAAEHLVHFFSDKDWAVMADATEKLIFGFNTSY